MAVPFRPDRKRIRRDPVVSTAVRTVGYDKARAVLQVEVIDRSVYDYAGVPHHVYEMFMNAASKGQYYNGVIKPNYPECYRIREGETLPP
ncbi:MAG TPA: KTSC domain-containing protein [Rhodanobacter sp.]